MDYFTSDLHLFHANVIRYSKRPFASLEEMHAELIRRWNERVRPQGDTVYLLGDVSFGHAAEAEALVNQLHGTIHLYLGNHDKGRVRKFARWASVQSYGFIKSAGERIALSHYAMRVWDRSHYGSWHFYGHSHGDLPAFGRSCDVGVDTWDYRPVTFNEVKERLTDLGTVDDFRNHHSIGRDDD